MNLQKDSRYSVLDKYTVVILLSGRAGVGKSTVADFMEMYLTELGYDNVSVASFAWGVKGIARYFGWNGNKDSKGRKLLQDVGYIGREYDEDIWVKMLLEKESAISIFPSSFLIIDDWRFPNESYYLENSNGYKVIKVRVYAPERETLKGTPYYDDISETALPEYIGSRDTDFYDWIVSNNKGTLDVLDKRVVRPLIDYILEKLEEA